MLMAVVSTPVQCTELSGSPPFPCSDADANAQPSDGIFFTVHSYWLQCTNPGEDLPPPIQCTESSEEITAMQISG